MSTENTKENKPEKNYETFSKNGLPSSSGSLHGNANIWFYKIVGEKLYLLFQKRAKNVHNGGTFDTTAGGHVDRGETHFEAVVRETEEEIGIKLKPEELYYIYGFNSGSSIFQIYLSDRTDREDVFTLNHEEVEALEWVELKDVDDFVKKNAKSPLKTNKAQFIILHEYFEKLLSFRSPEAN